jgi:hypothetical protein
VSLEVLSIKCRYLHRLPHPSKKIQAPKMDIATSWFLEKCILMPDFCTVPISTIIANTVHISSAVRGCPLIYPRVLENNTAPRISALLDIAYGLIHKFLCNVLDKKLFK